MWCHYFDRSLRLRRYILATKSLYRMWTLFLDRWKEGWICHFDLFYFIYSISFNYHFNTGNSFESNICSIVSVKDALRATTSWMHANVSMLNAQEMCTWPRRVRLKGKDMTITWYYPYSSHQILWIRMYPAQWCGCYARGKERRNRGIDAKCRWIGTWRQEKTRFRPPWSR